MFDTASLIENTPKYYNIYPVLRPLYTVAMAAAEICKYCGRSFG
jgi:hypothetical protein